MIVRRGGRVVGLRGAQGQAGHDNCAKRERADDFEVAWGILMILCRRRELARRGEGE